MSGILDLLKLIPVLVAALMIGSWFQSELRKVRASGQPMHKAYFSIPGILIILSVLGLPIAVWLFKHLR